MKECKKENITYKVEAMKCIGNLLEGYKVDQFKDMWTFITPVLEVSQSFQGYVDYYFTSFSQVNRSILDGIYCHCLQYLFFIPFTYSNSK